MDQATHRSSSGFVFVLAASFVWSTTGALLKYVMNISAIAPLALAFWRDGLVAAILLAGIGLLRRQDLRLSRRNFILLALYGVFGIALYHTLWIVSIARNGAAVATVLIFTSPAFVAVGARWLFQESLGRNKIASLIMTLAGCVLVSGAYDLALWRLDPVALITGVLSGVLFSLYSLFGREAARRSIPPWTVLAYSFTFAALTLGVLMVVSGAKPMTVGAEPYAWGVLIALAWGPTLGGFVLYNAGLARLQSSVASLILVLEPVFASILAFFWFGERLTPLQLLGAAFIVSAVLLLRAERQ